MSDSETPPRFARYRVLPLRQVHKEAQKILTAEQLREGIQLVSRLRSYPLAHDLSINPCGNGLELRIEGTTINPQGWLRAIVWVHEESKTIYVVDLFWKKTNQIALADVHRANHRIRQLKALLKNGGDPWHSGQ